MNGAGAAGVEPLCEPIPQQSLYALPASCRRYGNKQQFRLVKQQAGDREANKCAVRAQSGKDIQRPTHPEKLQARPRMRIDRRSMPGTLQVVSRIKATVAAEKLRVPGVGQHQLVAAGAARRRARRSVSVCATLLRT